MVTTTKLEWEVFEDKDVSGDWRVDAIGDDGEYYVTIFSGTQAKERAEQFAAWVKASPGR